VIGGRSDGRKEEEEASPIVVIVGGGQGGGMVQAWVGHFVTPLKCMYDEYD